MSVEINFRAVTGVTATSSNGSGSSQTSAWVFPNTTAPKTADYTVTTADGTVRADASSKAVAITLPPAQNCYTNGNGQVFCIKKEDGTENPVIVQTSSAGQMIDGFSSTVIAQQYDSLTIQSNGAGWDVISSN